MSEPITNEPLRIPDEVFEFMNTFAQRQRGGRWILNENAYIMLRAIMLYESEKAQFIYAKHSSIYEKTRKHYNKTAMQDAVNQCIALNSLIDSIGVYFPENELCDCIIRTTNSYMESRADVSQIHSSDNRQHSSVGFHQGENDSGSSGTDHCEGDRNRQHD